jgi:hypothetical protein
MNASTATPASVFDAFAPTFGDFCDGLSAQAEAHVSPAAEQEAVDVFDFGTDIPVVSAPADAASAPDAFGLGSAADFFTEEELAPIVVKPTSHKIEIKVEAGEALLLDISNEDYHACSDSASCSELKVILRSAAHLQAYKNRDRKELASQRIGTAFHAAVLEPQRFNDEYITYSERRYGTKWDAFKAAHPGKTIITSDEFERVAGMTLAVRAYTDLPLQQAIELGDAEKSIFWVDEETGVNCRIRPDLLLAQISPLMLDLKSTDDCRPDAFLSQMLRLDYDLQAAMYIHGAYAKTGVWMPFYIVACETDAPHGVWVYEIRASATDEIYMNGLRKFRRALSIYQNCLKTNEWPGYSQPMTRGEFLRVPKYHQFHG